MRVYSRVNLVCVDDNAYTHVSHHMVSCVVMPDYEYQDTVWISPKELVKKCSVATTTVCSEKGDYSSADVQAKIQIL